MVNYSLDLDKVDFRFQEVLSTNDNNKISEFAKEVIPLLIKDNRKVRLEYVDLIINKASK